MNIEINKLEAADFPPLLSEIPDAPDRLFVRGALPDDDPHMLCVVGSRKASAYAKDACARLIEGLSGHNIVIVSGLAFGIDAAAHSAAISAGLRTIAVPGSGLGENVIYPAANRNLAKKILEKGGALVSEYEPGFCATTWSFPRRNRIMAGLSHAILIVEAQERSGTLITARLGLDYNREVLAVPNPIFQPGGAGVNKLIRDGATPITESKDILEVFGIEGEDEISEKDLADLTNEEAEILEILSEPLARDELIRKAGMPAEKINSLVSMLEIKGLIKELGGKFTSCNN